MEKEVSVYQNVELRKLPEGSIYNLVSILDENEAWKKMMSYIPKNPRTPEFEPKYTQEHVRIIENYSKESKRPCTEILFDEWGTSGRFRPTLNTLLDVLVKAKIFRAADLVADWLKEPRPSRGSEGPEKPIDTEDIFIEDSLPNILINGNTANDELSDMSDIPLPDMNKINETEISDMIKFSSSLSLNNLKNQNLVNTASELRSVSDENMSLNVPDLNKLLGIQMSPRSRSNEVTAQCNSDSFDYQQSFPVISNFKNEVKSIVQFQHNEIVRITNNFSREIGSGGFGQVFIGYDTKYGQLAVKRTYKLHIALKLFTREVTTLSQLRHKNIVPIIGFSSDGPDSCIVCEFIDGGSLKQNLDKKYLNEWQRINIILGTAEGLSYLHKGTEIPTVDMTDGSIKSKRVDKIIHGDIKTDNILLTKDLMPKLCDFGLAKAFDQTYMQVSSIVGTKAYMGPEWYSGTITEKTDIFSFGIVMLEVLTGYDCIVRENGNEYNIKHYIETIISTKNESNKGGDVFNDIFDKSVPNWTKADELYNLAKKCVSHEMRDRPDIDEICDFLSNLCNENSNPSEESQ